MGSILSLLISTEYRNDIKSKSFWIGTFLFPIFILVVGFVVGFLMEGSDAMQEVGAATGPDNEITTEQAIGMTSGILLVIFIMSFGAQIFNKVKTEKTNRISEVLIGSVPGRTLMIAKVISVALVGITQMLIWAALIIGLAFVIFLFLPVDISIGEIFTPRNLLYLLIALLYFTGGFLFYGSLFAASGALTDRNNENQTYMTIITFTLMISMYIGMYATDNGASLLSKFCFYIPFTSPCVGGVISISGASTWWETLLSLLSLFGCAFVSIAIAGKIYTSAILLKGKKFSPKDILVFLRSK